ncbi:MAG: hypothetical protein AB1898_06595 [Acidobacteriota bacterium]
MKSDLLDDLQASQDRCGEGRLALSVSGVLCLLGRKPHRLLLKRWNWKSAVLSSSFRGGLFFVTNLSAGPAAAFAALVTEVVFRAAFSGFYGALTQAFRHVQPKWAATLTAMVLLPMANHSVELAVHWLRGTPELWTSIAASAAFTSVSTSFNLFAMRHGALIVGEGRQALWKDLLRMPWLVFQFIKAIGVGMRRFLTGQGRRSSPPNPLVRPRGWLSELPGSKRS